MFDLVFVGLNYKKYYHVVSSEKDIWCNHYIANVDSDKHGFELPVSFVKRFALTSKR
jgi:hypothetical protein